MKPTAAEIEAGQAVYTKRALSAYDLIVLGISNRYIWRCPTHLIESHYNNNVTSNHLDVGVGTGYFLDRCRFPADGPRIALMDMNANTLEFASKRIERYRPETYQQNILEEISQPIEPFDSVGINYLFHCLPGAIEEKAVALDYLKKLMNPGATVFGSTILQEGVDRGWLAKRLMDFYNKKGIFSNSEDSLAGLKTALSDRFDNVVIEVTGCVALFSGNAR
ncbi:MULTISPECIES: class I SAM-dependent methyltransferase [unclassified Microbulbifer]|uniref:class I SAM-dependent methyltransferase n=1 Tax=unclassified Microbulbifer TaxID=2619833 RepID=UPI0027E58136|nr:MULTISPECIES: class I SAM-dependent methyltransferase [unclassified Microbulbifer]